MRIRRAAPDDLAALLPLVERFCTIDEHAFDPVRVERALAPLLVDDALGQVHVVELADRITGYCVITWGWSLESGGREALLDEIYVDDRDRGHGSTLLEHAIACAQESGALVMFGETESANARVRAFYARHDFTEQTSVWISRDLRP